MRTKDGVEVDFLVHVGNGRAVAIEAKSSFDDFTAAQHGLLDSLGLDMADRWILVRGSLPPQSAGQVPRGAAGRRPPLSRASRLCLRAKR